MQNAKYNYKTIVLSDIHLGTSGSKARQVTSFIKQYSCEKLILNGDIVDGWQLRKSGSWKKKHTGFIRAVLKMIDKTDTQVFYLRGNHDDFLDQILPLKLGGNFEIRKDMVIESGNKRFFVTHGDVFDLVTKNMKWLAHIGDVGYTFLLWANKQYNHYRRSKGLPYYSLSQKVKGSIKAAVNFVSDFEEKLCEVAKSQHCDGIICGHIHMPAIKTINDITYMNSGDWVENMTALVEDFDGNWEIIYYTVESTYNEYEENKTEVSEFAREEAPSFDLSLAHLFQMK